MAKEAKLCTGFTTQGIINGMARYYSTGHYHSDRWKFLKTQGRVVYRHGRYEDHTISFTGEHPTCESGRNSTLRMLGRTLTASQAAPTEMLKALGVKFKTLPCRYLDTRSVEGEIASARARIKEIEAEMAKPKSRPEKNKQRARLIESYLKDIRQLESCLPALKAQDKRDSDRYREERKAEDKATKAREREIEKTRAANEKLTAKRIQAAEDRLIQAFTDPSSSKLRIHAQLNVDYIPKALIDELPPGATDPGMNPSGCEISADTVAWIPVNRRQALTLKSIPGGRQVVCRFLFEDTFTRPLNPHVSAGYHAYDEVFPERADRRRMTPYQMDLECYYQAIKGNRKGADKECVIEALETLRVMAELLTYQSDSKLKERLKEVKSEDQAWRYRDEIESLEAQLKRNVRLRQVAKACGIPVSSLEAHGPIIALESEVSNVVALPKRSTDNTPTAG